MNNITKYFEVIVFISFVSLLLMVYFNHQEKVNQAPPNEVEQVIKAKQDSIVYLEKKEIQYKIIIKEIEKRYDQTFDSILNLPDSISAERLTASLLRFSYLLDSATGEGR